MKKYTQDPLAYSGGARKKDYYDTIYNLVESMGHKNILDIGCASGDFFHFLPHDDVDGLGIDISEELIQAAIDKNNNKKISFRCVDLLKDRDLKSNKYDLITILGTLLTIEDHKSFLDPVFEMAPKQIIINDFFSHDGIDIRCGFKRANSVEQDFSYAYNIRSLDTINGYLSTKSDYTVQFEPYNLSTRLVQNSDDAMRNYHVDLGGQDVLIQGMNLIVYGYNVFLNRK